MDCLLALGPFIKIGHFFFAHLNNNRIGNLMLCLVLARLVPMLLGLAFFLGQAMSMDNSSFGIARAHVSRWHGGL